MKVTMIGWLIFFCTSFAFAGTFLETFNDKNLNDWQELNAHDAALGSWKVVEGELEMTNLGGGARLLTTGDETWQDYSIEVNVKPLEKRGPGNISIVARVEGSRAVWCHVTDLLLNDPESKVMCHSRDFAGNTGILLYMRPHRLLKLNRWSKLKLTVSGDHFIFAINEKKIAETGDPFAFIHDGEELMVKAENIASHLTGGAGFGLANYTARFDNITITGEGIPDRGGLSVTPRAKLATTWGALKGNR